MGIETARISIRSDDSIPHRVWTQSPRQVIVFKIHVENLLKPLLQLRVFNGNKRFDTTIKVSRHEISGPDVVDRRTVGAVSEVVDPRVFEETTDNRTNVDVL